MRAKLIFGELVYPPNSVVRPEGTVVGYPQREDLLIADGWKTVEDVAQPATGLWVGSWMESETAITRVWTPREMTAEEAAEVAAMAAQRTANEAATAGHALKLKVLRDSYAGATAQLCQLAGMPSARVLDMADIQTAVMPLLTGPNSGIVNGLLTLLTNLEGKLRSKDGDDALDRV
jgi:hypothetical protein